MIGSAWFAGYSTQERMFLLLFTAVVIITWYFTEPIGTRVSSALVAGIVSFIAMAAIIRITNEGTKQILLDILGLFP